METERTLLSTRADAKVATLARSLPAALADRVNAAIDEWREGGKIARLWAQDSRLWTDAREASWLGWLTIPMDQLTHAHRFTAFVDDIRSGDFEHALILGMGGSSLCPEVLSLTFPTSAGLPRLRVLDSTDPQQIEILEEGLDLSKTLFFVSSKSGTTLEPNIFAAYFYAHLTDLLGAGEAGRHFIAITDPGTVLERLAKHDGYRAVFHGWPAIGSSSLIATGRPSSGRGSSPPGMYRASAARAFARACSKRVCTSALTIGSTAPARAITASTSSTGESVRDRNAASASVAGR